MAAHSYWRVLVNGMTLGNINRVIEAEFRSSVGGADECVGGSVITDGSYSTPSIIFDDVYTVTPVSSSLTAVGSWFGYQFAAPISIAQIRIRLNSYYDDIFPTSLSFQYSDDGLAWTTETTTTPITWTSVDFNIVDNLFIVGSPNFNYSIVGDVTINFSIYKDTSTIPIDGGVISCGYNSFYQLGFGDATQRLLFEQIPFLPSDVKKIAATEFSVVILKTDGSLYGVGRNEYGELGLGDTNSRITWTQITTNASNVVDIEGNYNGIFYLKNDGSIYFSGSSLNGNAGLGTAFTIYNTITLISNGTGSPVVKFGRNDGGLSVGVLFTIDSNGNISSSGNNYYGTLGRGSVGFPNVYGTLGYCSSIANVIDISSGRQSIATGDITFAVTSNGDLYDTDTLSFTGSFNLTNITDCKKAIAGGSLFNSHVIKTDNSLWELTPTTINNYTETKILDSVKQVEIIGDSFFAILLDGTVWVKGNNDNGQLGFGDTVSKAVFTKIPTVGSAQFVNGHYSNDGGGNYGYSIYIVGIVLAYNSYTETTTTTVQVSSNLLSGSIYNLSTSTTVSVSSSIQYGKGNVLAIAQNTENKAISVYNNFDFDGSCVFKGKTLLIKDTGLFQYGGNFDNGEYIESSIKTGKMDYVMGKGGLVSTQQNKVIPTSNINLGLEKVGGSVDLNVTADSETFNYNDDIERNGFGVIKIPVGRRIKYNKIQLEVASKNCDSLNIESIEFEPEVIKRRNTRGEGK